MKIRVVTCVLLLLLSLAAQGEIYRSVDADGNVTFTDQPAKDSKKLDLAPLTVIPSVEVTNPQAGESEQDTPGTASYSIFQILDPINSSTVRANGGQLQVILGLEPLIQKSDHRIHLFLDGQEAAKSQGTTVTLNGVNRGEHRLQAQVRDGAGNVLISTDQIQINVLRQSVAQ